MAYTDQGAFTALIAMGVLVVLFFINLLRNRHP
jgi:hypothetical protein